MPTEESPLLASESGQDLESDHDAIYNKYPKRQKNIILALVSWAGLIPLFVGSSFVPLIPQIAKDLDSDGATISWAVSLSILTISFASMFWATYSGFCMPIYLGTMPCLTVGSLGVAQSTSVPELMVWRIIQAFGASAGLSVGAAIVGDIYKPEERGTAMGIFLAACLIGPALAPPVGGVVARYATWRVMQDGLAVAGISVFLLMFFFMPETSHPNTRGIDKLPGIKWKWVWLNPLKSLWLLRSPNLLAVTFVGFTAISAEYILLLPIAYTMGIRYNITNEAIIGTLFIPAGLGNLIGAPLGGRISDNIFVKWRKRRQGKWVPEDRLRAALLGAALFVPLSVLMCGLITTFIPGTLGIVLNLISLFMNGVGVDLVLTPITAYNVDIMHSQSAQLMSAHSGLRNFFLAILTTLIIPSVTNIGVLVTNIIAAIACWIGFLLLWITIKYGEQMRAWVDVGYSATEDM